MKNGLIERMKGVFAELTGKMAMSGCVKCGVLCALVAAGLTAFAAEDAAVEYVGADGMLKTLPAGGYELVTAATDTIGGGRWYVVKGTVSRGMIVVDGSAHLVLCDGAKLIVKSAIEQAGIAVCEGHSLDIWGQSNGTGELTAMGGDSGAGIGGGSGATCGTVAIYGGIVTAQGGLDGAGIGGGGGGSGGTVTINGGTVTATGGFDAAGIGGGDNGSGGKVTINGGTVKAQGGLIAIPGSINSHAPGIGAGRYGGYDANVTINGGSISSTICGAGYIPVNGAGKNVYMVELQMPQNVTLPQEVRLSCLDGYGFNDAHPVNGKACVYLPDGQWTINADYQGLRYVYSVSVSGSNVVCTVSDVVCVVTIGPHPGMSVSWTSGDGTEVHAVNGTYFTVPRGASNVRVSFAAQSGRVLEGASTVSLGAVYGSVVFGGASGPSLPTVRAVLPTGYVPLDWIASDGKQYIDTEYVHTANTRVVCTLEALTTQHSWWSAVFGARNGSFHSNAFCFFAASDRDYDRPRYNRSGVETLGSGFPVGKVTVLTCNGLTALWQYDGNFVRQITATGGRVEAGANTMFVFNLNTAGAGGKRADTSGADMKLYGFQIYEGDSAAPVRDFVPCFSLSNQVGLYDLVNGRFYANAGSGEFAVSDPDAFHAVEVGAHPHVSVAWTFGDGTVTNKVIGEAFRVLSGTENVRVLFTPEFDDFHLVGSPSVDLGTVSDDVTLGAEQVPVAWIEYVDAKGVVTEVDISSFEVVKPETSEFLDGRWYLARGNVSRGPIMVRGKSRLILMNGCRLCLQGQNSDHAAGLEVNRGSSIEIYGQVGGSGVLEATGDSPSAGIGGRQGCEMGTVTINGGTVNATGGAYAAGIGSGHAGRSGSVIINAGTVTAKGGIGYKSGQSGAGIGCGYDAEGTDVSIGGGTVIATGGTGAVDIGGTKPCHVTISGGNVVASSIREAPMDEAVRRLHKVTLIAPNGGMPVFEGLDGYGLRDVAPVDGKFCFYLPDGSYEVALEMAGVHRFYYFIVMGADVVCTPRELGLTVNGDNVGNGVGDGWKYENGVLNLNDYEGRYVLSGVSTNGEVQVRAVNRCTVDLEDAIIYTQGRPAFTIGANATVTLRMAGGVSHLAATNALDGTSVPAIEADMTGDLNVDVVPDADSSQSAILVFNFGETPAIAGGVAVSVKAGCLCVWSDRKAIDSDCILTLDSSSDGKIIGQVGPSWSDLKLVGCGYWNQSEFGRYSHIEVAPAYGVYVPASIEHIRGVSVSNSFERLLSTPVGTDGSWTNRYCAMLEDAVFIAYEPEDGYTIVSENPQVVPYLTNDVVIGTGAYPLPEVRKILSVTLPETLEGETYVVTEDGVEVEGEVEGEGNKVYSVALGSDVEIVCTAQENWRLVSATNVVAFTNLQENVSLSAADLPQAWKLFTVSIPATDHVIISSMTSTDDEMVPMGSDVWQILSNSEVSVSFDASTYYRITANGAKTWTLTGDVVFGTTDGFPLPTVEGIPGTVADPWTVGENVQAYTNIAGVLTITGTGVMNNFTNAADVPWDPAAVRSIAIGNEVTKIGVNTWSGMSGDVVVDGGLPLSRYAFVGEGFAASEEPSGSISPAEFERVDIVDGVALLGVSVYTSDAITNQNWSVATNGVIEVPAEGKQGFFYLMSKPAVPSDFGGGTDFIAPVIPRRAR